MNERMIELYRQAQVPDTAFDPSNNMPYKTTRFSADKFAELIVNAVYDYILDATMDDNPFPFSEDVKKHFGVEE